MKKYYLSPNFLILTFEIGNVMEGSPMIFGEDNVGSLSELLGNW